MSKTVDELVRVYCDAFYAQRDKAPAEGITQADRAGIIAVVTALRDEILRDYGGNNHSWCERVALGAINEILAPREGGQAAGGSTREDGRSVEQLAATSSHAVTAPATAPAPAVCEWTPQRSLPDWRLTSCGMVCTEQSNRNGKCQSCGKPIKFTEAQR